MRLFLPKSVLLVLTIICSVAGAIAQVTEAKVYTIGSDAQMFGKALEPGTIIYNRQDKSTYLLTEAVEATQSLFSTSDKIRLNGTSDTGHGQASENVAVVTNYGAVTDGLTDISSAVEQAMADADVILFPATNEGKHYLISSNVRIPLNKTFRIENGAVIHVIGNLIGEGTRLEAGPYEVFTAESNLTGSWKADVAYPEWFGANRGVTANDRPAIQKTLDVFRQNVWLTGEEYQIEGSVLIGARQSIYMNMFTTLVPSSDSNADLFVITGEPFMISGGKVIVEKGYDAWIFNVSIDRQGESDNSPRKTSVIRDITIEGFLYGENDFSGMAYNGIKLRSAKKGDYSYFSTMDNVHFYRPDTAIYLTGHDESGMNNSWHWSNITIDWTMRGIVIDRRAAGHVFTNLVIQPNTRVNSTVIEVASKYNSFQGVIWDVHSPNTIVLKRGSEHNYFSHMGRVDIYERFVEDNSGHKALNIFNTSNPFEPTHNHYSVYTDERVGIGIRDSRSSNVPQFAARGTSSFAGAFIQKTSMAGTADLDSFRGTAPALVVSTQTDTDMMDGFGGGLLFNLKDALTDTTEYGQDIAARILARRDGADNRGMLQFYTVDANAAKPAMTLRNNGKVGIGTVSPLFMLDVNGNFRVTGKASLEDVLHLLPRNLPPADPEEGDLYVSKKDHHIYCFLEGQWKILD